LSFTQQPLSQKVNKINKVSKSFTSLFWLIEILFGTCHLDHTTDTTVTDILLHTLTGKEEYYNMTIYLTYHIF